MFEIITTAQSMSDAAIDAAEQIADRLGVTFDEAHDRILDGTYTVELVGA